ncbi:sigma-70 family RNA polymerase sigma factor [Actinacidiphila oryziradicis]|jgi:RNA polymerase sigma factor (sigma-70 family)|uniref:Sigma-70 family RNA polymerase sigma factor n=1 Tax=Actinacidiphila oryziradicis TaxID=2571141 RepID=A0A4V5N0L9_9ACTN|nr:sigma-70 family RNA polymerase sigma factor [Actinacidiphila oryziradicis]TKA12419.1 sigma-70 family RNA polymerase sigma factor [Actinacidiphila oryziradicis]
MLYDDELTRLRPLLAAEAAAEAVPGGIEAADLEQAVWLRLLELPGSTPPSDTAAWLRAAVRAEARRAARRVRREVRYPPGRDPVAEHGRTAEEAALDAERLRAVRAAVRRLPGRCPQLVIALMSHSDPTYREISMELGISQGSLGPMRSRCLGCLRSMLVPEVASHVRRGKAR